MTGLQLVNTMQKSGKSLSELKKIMEKYPQVLVNVQVRDKQSWQNNEAIAAAISEVEKKLGEDGRVLVRPSGTEPLIRVMVEGPDKDQVKAYAGQIADVIERELTWRVDLILYDGRATDDMENDFLGCRYESPAFKKVVSLLAILQFSLEMNMMSVCF